MKRLETIFCGLAVAALTSAPLIAQDNVVTRQRSERESASQLDGKTHGANVRASKLIGMNIQNPQGKNVGEINDLVVDANTGKIRYAAVTYGGFLGIGNKMFAVPFEAFKCQPNPTDPKTTVLILDVTQQQLEGSVGFDESSWPDFADQNMTLELDKRYKVKRNMQQRNTQVDGRVESNR
jgi:sporulation protein YlmC with PRC-barrel domain